MLASGFLHEPLPPTFVFWRGVAQRLFTALCHNPNLQNASTINIPKPAEAEWSALAEAAPPMKGLEYLNGAVLARLWDELDAHVHAAIAQAPGGAAAYLKSCNPVWNAVGRVTFHLAENKRNPAYPFAFLATYTHRISEQGKVQHLPLGRALEEYAGAKNRAALAALLSPVQRAAEQSKLARELLDSRADVSSPGLAARAGVFVFAEHSAFRAKRPGGADSGLVEGGPAAPAAGDRADRRGHRETCSARTVCWISRCKCRWRANR